MQYKGFDVDDTLIDKYVESLECSITEACDLILEESGKIKPSEETEKAVNSIKSERRYEKSDKKRKPTTRERKVDETKKSILAEVRTTLEDMGAEVEGVKTETEIAFTFGGDKYTVKLTKHRPPKK
jgi:hypothetical protein